MDIAKKSVETAVRDHKLLDFGAVRNERLMQERGAFVTLKKRGQLRGCIGYVAPVQPLALTVRDVAAFAALRDQRFQPVAVSELAELEYEISVLSPLRRVLESRPSRVGTVWRSSKTRASRRDWMRRPGKIRMPTFSRLPHWFSALALPRAKCGSAAYCAQQDCVDIKP
jgi:hypothetical protein